MGDFRELWAGGLLTLTFLLCVRCSYQVLFDYGVAVGDAIAPPLDDGSYALSDPGENFPLGASHGRLFEASGNGAFSGSGPFVYFSPSQPMPFPGRDLIIIPYFADANIVRGGAIFYRTSKNGTLLAAIDKIVQRVDSTFLSRVAAVVSWIDVPSYSNFFGMQRRNTFQFVLVSNGTHSYGVFTYDKLTYHPPTDSLHARAGYGISSNFFCELPGSGTGDVLKLQCRSNIGIPGQWVVGLSSNALATCPTTYSTTCSGDILACASSPCKNNGQCTDMSNGMFVCACPAGFSGPTCDTALNPCTSLPCLNGGTCQASISLSSYTCSCTSNYTGANCEVLSACARAPCLNGGTCQASALPAGYQCACARNYTGTNCENELSACDSRPCLNNGTCLAINSSLAYQCVCSTGFTGRNCERESNPCDSGPCANGGVCQRLAAPGSYQCTCAAGFTGTNCQTDINECRNVICVVGYCQDLINAFVCVCPPGNTGTYCETVITPCFTANGGCEDRCVSLSATSFRCECRQGVLSSDLKTCRKTDYAIVAVGSKIFFSAAVEPFFLTNSAGLIDVGALVTGVDYSFADGLIFVTVAGNGTVLSMKSDGTGRTVVFDGIPGIARQTDMDAVAFDWLRGDIFISYGPYIVKFAPGGRPLIMSNGTNPRGLVVRPKACHRQIFWTDYGVPAIYSGSMDLFNAAPVALVTNDKNDLGFPNGLAADLSKEKLYWIDSLTRRIESVNFDGSCRQVIGSTGTPSWGFGLAYFSGHLYYTNWQTFALYRMSVTSGNFSIIEHYEDLRPKGVAVYTSREDYPCGENPQACNVNPCEKDNGGCEDVCNPNPFSCSCTYGELNASDSRSCILYPYVYYSYGSAVLLAHPRQTLTISGFNRVVGVAHDYNLRLLFWSDASSGGVTIGSTPLKNLNLKRKFIDIENSVCDALLFEPKRRALYAATLGSDLRDGSGKIYRLDLDSNGDLVSSRVLVSGGRPRGLVAVSDCGFSELFFTDWGSVAGIRACNLDAGSTRPMRNLVRTDITTPTALTVDYREQKLFWIDVFLERLEFVKFDGTCRTRLAATPAGSLAHAAVFTTSFSSNGILLWTDTFTKTVMATSLLNPSNHIVFVRTPSEPFGIGVFQSSNVTCGYWSCVVANATCYPFGPREGDLTVPRGDDNAYAFLLLSRPMPLFSTLKPGLYININGHVTVDAYSSESGGITFPHRQVIISPYAIDLLTETSGDIFYRESSEVSLLRRASSDVSLLHPASGFMPSQLVIATWHQVPIFGDSEKRHTFQLVLASNGSITYAILCYVRLDSGLASVGFSENSCNYRTGQYSGSPDSRLLVDNSNVGVPGKYVYLLTNRECLTVPTTPGPNMTTPLILPTTPGPNMTSPPIPSTTPGPNVTASPPPTLTCFPFGPSVSDYAIPSGDLSSSVALNLSTPMPLFTSRDSTIFVNRKGHVTVKQPYGPGNLSFERIIVAPYALDVAPGGRVYFRETFDATQLSRASVVVDRSLNATRTFAARQLVVVTWFLVPDVLNGLALNAFQLVLASDFFFTYAIFCYIRLESPGAVAGFNENACNNYVFPLSGPDSRLLLNYTNIGVPGMSVLRLTNYDCLTGSTTPVPSTNSVTTPVRPTTPPLLNVTGVFIELFYRSTGPFGSDAFWFSSVPRYAGGLPATSFVEVVSGNFSSSASISTTNLPVLGFKYFISFSDVLSPSQSFLFYGMVILDDPPSMNSDAFQHGRIVTPAFFMAPMCLPVSFRQRMRSVPSVKVTADVGRSSAFPNDYTNLWLKQVSDSQFTVCFREGISFSGAHRITINYMAVAGQVGNFTERGISVFPRSIPGRSSSLCKRENFQYQYARTPYVFVTAEHEDEDGCSGEATAWIGEVTQRYVVLCALHSKDEGDGSTRATDVRVHYIVAGAISPCFNFTCPRGLECLVNYSDTQPYCGCAVYCPEPDPGEALCGTDFVTYPSLCQFYMKTCMASGLNSTAKVEVLHTGKCRQIPYDSGVSELDPMSGMPGAFCRFVYLNAAMFYDNFTVHVFLTVNWRGGSGTDEPHDAAAAWSEGVSRFGFKACVLVAGRHYFASIANPPRVNWVAAQMGTFLNTYSLEGGVVELAKWYAGSKCHQIYLKNSYRNDFQVIVSVEHSKRNNFQDAMTAWTEILSPTAYSFSYRTFRLCARELQNFDGLHEGVRLHWMVVYSPVSPYLSEARHIVFEPVSQEPSQPARCKTVLYNSGFPSLAKPTVLLSVTNVTSTYFETSWPSDYSNDDYAHWIEKIDDSHMTVCFKSIRSGLFSVWISYVVLPSLCENGWTYFDGKCYSKITSCTSFDAARASCESLAARLPVVDNAAEDYFLQALSGADFTWIGLTLSGATWTWLEGADSGYRNFQPGKPDGDGSCALIQGGLLRGWDDVSCTSCNYRICEKDANLGVRSCLGYCLNGRCMATENGTSCICDTGYVGERCETSVLDLPACVNYTTINEPWRRYVTLPVPQPVNKTCDSTLSGWVRFVGASGGKLLESFCVNSTMQCGVQFPGWLGGTHPSNAQSTATIPVYFYSGFCGSHRGIATIQYCGSFYTYRFENLPWWSCDFGLCTSL